MSEKTSSISLYELNRQIKSGIKELFPGNYWIIAEISEMNTNQSGHCYLELMEKKEGAEQIQARAKATIWAYTFRMLKPYFESVTGQKLMPGIKVMVQVGIDFHEVYGYSLNIKDIEPNFTLGDLSRKRQEIIRQLQDEGVFHLNKELELPLVPQRIAVISSETAAGYGDFIQQLSNNRNGFGYQVKLFNAIMQGNDAEQSIVDAFDRIFSEMDNFDLVVIIRGGGSQLDLNCFNAYWLCYHITQFPLPVLTGIGHDRDETIADLVAHTNLKTPTAVAEFILEKTLVFDELLEEAKERLVSITLDQLNTWNKEMEVCSQKAVSTAKIYLSSEKQKVKSLSQISVNSLKSYLQRNKRQLSEIPVVIKSRLHHHFNYQLEKVTQSKRLTGKIIKSKIKHESLKIQQMETTNHLLDPVHILKRGFSLSFKDGKLIKSANDLKAGDQMVTKWIDGNVQSTIDSGVNLPNK